MDIRDSAATLELIREHRPDVVIHLAAQVAVTHSIENPRWDFEVNALGTFNLLEAIRLEKRDAIFLNASTNKVYGNLEHLRVKKVGERYQYADLQWGVDESCPLDFHSPYGCSKGAADQYVLDYARTYGMRTTSFRQSCIYGPGQLGEEDQGWVAWFCIAALLGKPITIYGDGCQVRDLLYIDDLTRLYCRAVERIDQISGKPFNVGGGPKNTLSLLELLAFLRDELKQPLPSIQFAPARLGDQRVFICDIRRAQKELEWEPVIPPKVGVTRLYQWLLENRELFEDWV
ncbi:MAG: CDP-paratose 2-epimerase [Candidatus Poribacteria bacterium]|nr:MAG: CDP-paratose 2-epimerase [Candidatus Poribacteria bacterium]